MRWLVLTGLVVTLPICLPSHVRAGVRVGTGFSTVTSGRQIPALSLGLDFGKDWSGSTMLSGAQTKDYYTSGFMVNALSNKDWGDFWFGRLHVGFGGGLFYGEKGIYMEVDENGDRKNFKKDIDNTFGPAFRVAFKPFANSYVSVEYLMGIGGSIFSNAWEDVGMGAIGVEL